MLPTPLLAGEGGVEAAQRHDAGIGDSNGDGLADALLVRDDGLLGVDTINGDPPTDLHVLGQLGAQWTPPASATSTTTAPATSC